MSGASTQRHLQYRDHRLSTTLPRTITTPSHPHLSCMKTQTESAKWVRTTFPSSTHGITHPPSRIKLDTICTRTRYHSSKSTPWARPTTANSQTSASLRPHPPRLWSLLTELAPSVLVPTTLRRSSSLSQLSTITSLGSPAGRSDFRSCKSAVNMYISFQRYICYLFNRRVLKT